MQIILQSVLFKPSKKNIISILEKVLSEELDASIGTAPQIKEIPVQLFDKQRTQWKSNDILQWLSDMYKPSKSTKILAICDFDAYSGHLNFVFGEAIYLPRLRQEFYGLKPDGSLFYQRLVKETVHELGHAFGLNHCKNKRCVMHFSRIANHRQRIQICIDNLIDSQLLIIKDKVKSEKNELQTPLYAFSLEGIIVALLCRYHNISSDKYKDTRRRIEDQVFSIIFHLFSQYNSHIVDFVSKIYLKAKEKGFSESMVLRLLKILKDSNIQIRYMKDALNWALYFHIEKGQQTEKEFFNIYIYISIETLNELDEGIRKIILYHEKAEIESRFHLYQPPKDWEEMWIKNIQDASNIVLYGICQNKACLIRFPVLVDYYNYRTEMSSKGHLKRDCNKCNSIDSIYVSL